MLSFHFCFVQSCVSCSLFVSPHIIVTAFVIHVVFLPRSVFDTCRRELGITFQNADKCDMQRQHCFLTKRFISVFSLSRSTLVLAFIILHLLGSFCSHCDVCVFMCFYAVILKCLQIGYFWDIVYSPVNVSCSPSWQLTLVLTYQKKIDYLHLLS